MHKQERIKEYVFKYLISFGWVNTYSYPGRSSFKAYFIFPGKNMTRVIEIYPNAVLNRNSQELNLIL
tara:strand:- start:36 stop:236 length:201 start_codon:yes stop_codon:yes gene_type:complete